MDKLSLKVDTAMIDNESSNKQNIIALCLPITLLEKEFDQRLIWFDSAHQHFLLYKDSVYYIWSLSTSSLTSSITTHVSPKTYYQDIAKVYRKENRTEAMLAKVSLDMKLLALQLTHTRIQIIDTSNEKKWVVEIKNSDDNCILFDGLIWSDHGGNSQDLIIVTLKGLELYKISSLRSQCKLSRTVPLSSGISGFGKYWYEPNNRMILLASNQLPSQVKTKRFLSSSSTTNSNLNKLQHLQATNPTQYPLGNEMLLMNGYFFCSEKADNFPKLELPPPEKIPSFELGPGIRGDDISLATVYGRLCCLVYYKNPSINQGFISVILLSKTSVVRSRSLALGSSPKTEISVKISITDNLIFCHVPQLNYSLIFDVKNSISVINNNNNNNSYKEKDSDNSTSDRIEPISNSSRMYIINKDQNGKQTNINSRDRDTNRDSFSNNNMRESICEILLPTNNHLTDDEWDDSVGVASHSPIKRIEIKNRAINNNIINEKEKVIINDKVEIDSLFDYNLIIQGQWECLSPHWLWDKKSNKIWKINYQLRRTSHLINDINNVILFLSRRGRIFPLLKSITYNRYLHGDNFEGGVLLIGIEAKQLIFERIMSELENANGYSQLEIIFKQIVQPYYNEHNRMLTIIESRNQINESSNDNNTSKDAIQIDSKKGDNTLRNRFREIMGYETSTIPTPIVTDGNMDNNKIRDGVYFPNNTNSDMLISSTAPLSSVGNILLQKYDLESLEPAHTLHLFLPDISIVGGRICIRKFSSIGESNNNNLIDNKKSDIKVKKMNSSPVPLSTRRDIHGNLVITQTEILSHVWLPFILNKISNGSNLDYSSWALTSYIASYRSVEAPVHPALSMLLLNLLTYKRKYIEISRLLQLHFFSDNSELAMSALELSDTIEYTELNLNNDNKNYCKINKNRLLSKNKIIKSAITSLRQVSLDMLWRLRERTTVVRWLLGRGLIIDSISLCSKKRGQWRECLSPASIPGVDFFISAIICLQAMSNDNISPYFLQDLDLSNLNATNDSIDITDIDLVTNDTGVNLLKDNIKQKNINKEGAMIELLHTVYKFIDEWDHSVITITKGQTKSKLGLQTTFPDNILSESHTNYFKDLFGFRI